MKKHDEGWQKYESVVRAIKKKVRTVTEQVKPARPDGYEAKFDENKDEKKREHNVCGARTRSHNIS